MLGVRSRGLKSIAVVAVLAVAAGACGGGDDDAASSATTRSGEGAASSATTLPLEKTVVIAGSGGELGQAYQRAFKPWADANGVTINWVEGLATDHVGRLVAQKNNPEFDLFQGELVSHFSAGQQGVFQPLDTSVVTNLKDWPDKGQLPDKSAVVHLVDTVGAWWNQKKFDENNLTPPKTWDDFWALLEEPEMKGHFVFPSIDNGYMRAWVALQLEDVADPTPVFQRLSTIDKAVLDYPQTPAQMHDLAVSGRAWLGVNGFTRIQDMVDANVGVAYTIPDPSPVVPVSWSFVKGAPHPNAAQSLVEYILSEEGQKRMAEETGLSPMRPGVHIEGKGYMSEAELARVKAWDYKALQQNLEAWRTKFAQLVQK
jgi:putative spermidine/putrescine transport system substrate-binding protein